MSKRMTVTFRDEDLYTLLKTEAAKRGIPANDIIADAIREWIETREDAELFLIVESARAEFRQKGRRSWSGLKPGQLPASLHRCGIIQD